MFLFKKKLIAILILLSVLLSFCACGENTSSENYAEIALITDVGTINDGSFNEAIWNGILRYSDESGIKAKYYQPTIANETEYLAQIKLAVNNGAKIIICPGYLFETAVYKAQKQYKKVNFVIIDGLPHSEDYSDSTINDNTMAITFAEEQAGFLAGYAAVRDGYTNIGFIGGVPEDTVIRYGYGFVQGADFAAIQIGMPISVRFTYTNTFVESASVEQVAASWFENDTDLIFACGGSMGRSIIRAAEEHDGKVIGVDIDQSSISPVVITSAIKSLDTATYNAINSYYNGSFNGGIETHLTARENGVKLPFNSSQFNTYELEDYSYIYELLVDGLIDVYNKTDIGTCEELSLVNTEVSYIVLE